MTIRASAVRTLRDTAYSTYPHCNGFYESGTRVVLGTTAGDCFRLFGIRLDGQDEKELISVPLQQPNQSMVCFDVCDNTGMIAAVWDNTLWVIDLRHPGTAKALYTPEEGTTLQGLTSISSVGDRIVVGQTKGDQHTAVEVETATGHIKNLFTHTWFANHFHFCPHDEAWLAFSHEGKTETIPDRVWGWHAAKAPNGICLFDQRSDDPSKPLCVGHERWAFHDTCAFAVAYGVSPAGPRGLYQVFPDDRSSRLVSGSDRDWHCDISRDGTMAVVDTTGPYDQPGCGWENSNGTSDIMAIETATGERTFLARTGIGPHHPHHPHPVIAPGARNILFNHSEYIDGQLHYATKIIDLA